MRYRTILLFGAPGSGKGTQGKILGTIPGYYHCSCGEVFRRLRPETDLGRTFLDYSSQGRLVPDEFTVRLWRENIQAETQAGLFDPSNHLLVLDGLPRNRPQAEILHETLDVLAILNLTCPDNRRLIARMQRRALKENRLDDANLEVIQRRFQVYEQETRDLLSCYPPHLVHLIDATQPPVQVLRYILEILCQLDYQPQP
jgi:adenylate kinase